MTRSLIDRFSQASTCTSPSPRPKYFDASSIARSCCGACSAPTTCAPAHTRTCSQLPTYTLSHPPTMQPLTPPSPPQIGFHIFEWAQNFIACCRRLLSCSSEARRASHSHPNLFALAAPLAYCLSRTPSPVLPPLSSPLNTALPIRIQPAWRPLSALPPCTPPPPKSSVEAPNMSSWDADVAGAAWGWPHSPLRRTGDRDLLPPHGGPACCYHAAAAVERGHLAHLRAAAAPCRLYAHQLDRSTRGSQGGSRQ